jgi:signal transduction histidine kinase
VTSSPLPFRVPAGLGAGPLSGRVPRLLIAGLVLWILSITVVHDLRLSAGTYLPGLARFLAAESFVIAALFSVQHWRATSDHRSLRAAIAFGALGVGLPAAAVLTPWSADGVHVQFDAILVRAALSAVVFALLGPGASTLLPLRRVLLRGTEALVAAAAAGVALALVIGSTAAGIASEALLVVGWTALLWVRRRSMVGQRSTPTDWTSAAIIVMGLDESIRLLCVAVPGSLLGSASGFDLAAGGVFAWAAYGNLRRCRRTAPADMTDLARELVDIKSVLNQAQQVQRDRLHDARSALVGVAGASALLARSDDTATVDRSDLARMIVAELARLQAILDTETVERTVDFDLAEALRPVLTTHGLTCPALHSQIQPMNVRGRPLATATALDDLLRNAARHAPGATVTVATRSTGDTVEILVEDDGPGIPSAERTRVLERGARGSTAHAPGSGLGLHNAAEAIRAQAGELRLDESAQGGLLVTISLPLAGSPAGSLEKVAC